MYSAESLARCQEFLSAAFRRRKHLFYGNRSPPKTRCTQCITRILVNSLKGKWGGTTRTRFPLDDLPFRGFARSRGTLSRAHRKFPPSSIRPAREQYFPCYKTQRKPCFTSRRIITMCERAVSGNATSARAERNILRDDNREGGGGTADTSTRYFRVAPGNSWQRTELRTTYGLVHKTSTLLRRYSISRYF